MARIHSQTSLREIALCAQLCLGKLLKTQILQITCFILFAVILWTAIRIAVSSDGNPTLCVAVLSASNQASAERRDVARETWLSLDDGVRHYFFVGSENLTRAEAHYLDVEQRRHGDVQLLPLVDSYQNLTLKLLHSIKYLVERADCKYIMKADDDSFARIDLIVSELELVKIEKMLYWGYFTGKAPIFRRGTWAEQEWFLCDKYLPYARGGGYVFSQRVAKFIADNVPFLQRYASEDVSFGTWTAGLQLHRVHDPRFDTEYQSRGCLNSYLVTHKQSISQMWEKMRNIRLTGRFCAEGQEFETRRAYSYNWKVLPSQCCETT